MLLCPEISSPIPVTETQAQTYIRWVLSLSLVRPEGLAEDESNGLELRCRMDTSQTPPRITAAHVFVDPQRTSFDAIWVLLLVLEMTPGYMLFQDMLVFTQELPPLAIQRPLLRQFGTVALRPKQCESVHWMMHEEGASRQVDGWTPIRFADGFSISMGGEDGSLNLFDEPGDAPRFVTRGKVLHNATGTGKTAVAISLCANDPAPRTDGAARASLVCVPINLMNQWKNEIAKFWPEARVVSFSCIRGFKKIQPRAIQDADIVLTTYSFLRGKSYAQHRLDLLKSRWHRSFPVTVGIWTPRNVLRPDVVRSTAADMFDDMITTNSPEKLLLESFLFRRVFLDEVHELAGAANSGLTIRSIHSLRANFIWGMTATPPVSACQLQMFSNLLLQTDPSAPHRNSAVLRCFRSIASDNPVAFRETVHYVTPSAVECAVIQSQVCLERAVQASISLRGMVSSDDSTVVQDSREEIVHSLLRASDLRIRDLQATADELRAYVDSSSELNLSAALRARFVGRGNDGLLRVTTDLGEARRRREFIETAAAEQDRTCVVCMESETDTMFGCGHSLCYACACNVQQTAPRCPMCRAPIARMYRVADAADASQSEGCKFDAMMGLLRGFQERQESVVIFVQWSRCLAAVSHFVEQSMPVLRLTGNSFARARTLHEFSQRQFCVLFLALDCSSSGLDLVSASHVMFLHAVAKSEVRAIESQAIARVARLGQRRDVTVHHLVADGTKERDLFDATSRPGLVVG